MCQPSFPLFGAHQLWGHVRHSVIREVLFLEVHAGGSEEFFGQTLVPHPVADALVQLLKQRPHLAFRRFHHLREALGKNGNHSVRIEIQALRRRVLADIRRKLGFEVSVSLLHHALAWCKLLVVDAPLRTSLGVRDNLFGKVALKDGSHAVLAHC